MKFKYLLVSALACSFFTSHAQDITNNTFGKGMINVVAKDSTWSVKFAPRIQFRANANWNLNDNASNDVHYNFLIRRARLKFSGFAFSPKLKYKIELGLSNRDVSGASVYTNNTPRYILDAVAMWNFYENFELWVGQTKLPGNIERVISSANLQLIDRSLLNGLFNIDRDIGFQLRNHHKLSENIVLREKFALSQGEGRNVTTGNLGGFQYTGRVELLPFGEFTGKGDTFEADLKREETPKLVLGATYNFNNDAVKTRGNLGSYMVTSDGLYKTNITTVFVDAMLKYNGFSLLSEFAYRDAENPVAVESDGTPALDPDGDPTGAVVIVGNSFNVQGGYVFKSNIEVVGRFTTIAYDDIVDRGNETQYTLGFSKYLVGHKLKVQSDFSYTALDGEKNFFLASLGFDLHF